MIPSAHAVEVHRVGHRTRLKKPTVEGYATLMGKDEERTLGGLKKLRPPGIKRSPPHILGSRTRCSAITLLLCFGSFFFPFLILSAPCGLAQVANAPQVERKVTLLAINDVYRIGGVERGRRGGLPRVRTLRRELEVKDRDLILLHAGDVVYPSLLSKIYDGEQMIDVLNTLDGDPFAFDHRLFVTFGNHEFDQRKFDKASILSSRVRESQFYWLRSNITFATDSQGLPVVRGENLIDSRIIQANGVKVGVFGLTTNIALADYVVRFADPKKEAKRLTQKLRSEGAEVIIAVTHLTVDEDKDILASLGPAGPDLIIGGHEHTKTHEPVGGRWVLKADADAVSALVVTVVPLRGELPWVRYEYKELEGDGPIPDPDVNRVVQRWHKQHQDLFCARNRYPDGCLDEVIGRTAVRLTATEEKIRSCETNLGNWIADQAREAAGADAAFINAGSLRLNQDLPVGAIYRRDLEELVQYPNKLRMIEIDRDKLSQVVNNAVSGWPANGRWLQISGFTFSHNHLSRGKDEARLLSLGQDRRPVEEFPREHRLRVVTTDYLLSPDGIKEDGYSMLDKAPILWESIIDLKSIILDVLKNASDGIAPKVERRIEQTNEPPCDNEPPSGDQTAGEKKHSRAEPVNNGTDRTVASLDVPIGTLAQSTGISTSGSLDELLKTIGLFIGTYGLAVFLVVYYAVRLYPEIQKERGEWIRQITILRQLIDPGNRSLTRDQARVVLQLVSDAFADKLRMDVFGSSSRMSASASYRDPEKIVSTYLFDETISYERGENTDVVLNKLYADITRLIRDRIKRFGERAEEQVEAVADYSKRDEYRLGQLRFGSGTLEEIWRSSYGPAVNDWKSGRPDRLSGRDRYEIDRAKRFLLEHPAAGSKAEEINRYFDSLEFINEEDYYRKLQLILNSKIEEQLALFDTRSGQE